MSYYIIIRGPAGVGKTTIAKKLQESLKAVYFSFDDILKKHQLEISDGRGISKESFLKANELVADDAKKEIEAGKVVIFDGCFYHKDQLENLITLLPFKYFVFDLKASLDQCIERDKSRKGIGEDSIRAVYKMVAEFDYGMSIETERKTIEDVVTELLTIVA
ncbi:MAG: AAA family ATPase [Candidatus Shapirobacteria bacterium]|nr:AAA family ATPase [Candidatus Shapirobacteria bacterium]